MKEPLVRVLGIKDNVLSFLSRYDIHECSEILSANNLVPSVLLVGCIGTNGLFMNNPKKLYDIDEHGYVINYYRGYYMRSILTRYGNTNIHPDIHVIDMQDEESGDHDFYVLKKIGYNQYRILFSSGNNIVSGEWTDTDAYFLTDDVISITYKVDEYKIKKCILYNLKTRQNTDFDYDSGLTFSIEDDKYLTYWSIEDYDDYGYNNDDDYKSKQLRIDIETMEDISIYDEDDEEDGYTLG